MSGESLVPDALEAQLRRLWSDAARSEREPVLRASTVNLIVVTDGGPAVPAVSQTLVQIASCAPGRMIVLAPDPAGAPDGIEAWLAIQCLAAPPGAGASQICCEQIVIEARGAPSVAGLPSVVRPLLEADVPAALWWRAPLPAAASLLDRLAAEVRMVVVDSARGALSPDGVTPGADPVAAIRRLVGRRGGSLRDLAFARLTPWRELTAAIFDLAPCRRMLDGIVEVQVACRPEAPEARLFVGWLASRLGWRPTGIGTRAARGYERPGGGRVTVRLQAVEEGAGLVRVGFEGPGVRASVRLGESTPAGDTLEAAVEMAGAPRVCQVTTLGSMIEARLVSAEVAMAGNDRVYEAAVRAVPG